MSDESKTNLITDILDHSFAVVDRLQELAERFEGIISTIYDSIEELNNVSAENRSTFRECIGNLIKLAKKLYELIDVVDDVYHFWQFDSEHMIKSLKENNDISDLKNWVDTLQRNLLKYQQKYQEYNELNNSLKVDQTLTKALEDCRKLENKAQSKKTVARAVGGTVAGTGLAVAAVGVPASIVAGVFTFGIGTAVGLAVTGAVVGTTVAAGTAGAVTAGVAAKIAYDYGKVIEAFRSLRSDLNLADTFLRKELNNHVSSVCAQTDCFSRALDEVRIESRRNDNRSRQLLSAMCLLERRGKELKATSSAARSSAKAAMDRLDNMTF